MQAHTLCLLTPSLHRGVSPMHESIFQMRKLRCKESLRSSPKVSGRVRVQGQKDPAAEPVPLTTGKHSPLITYMKPGTEQVLNKWWLLLLLGAQFIFNDKEVGLGTTGEKGSRPMGGRELEETKRKQESFETRERAIQGQSRWAGVSGGQGPDRLLEERAEGTRAMWPFGHWNRIAPGFPALGK